MTHTVSVRTSRASACVLTTSGVASACTAHHTSTVRCFACGVASVHHEQKFKDMIQDTEQDREALAAMRGKLGQHWASASRKTLVQRQSEYAIRIGPESDSDESSDW